MDWFLAAVLLAFGAICGAVIRLPIFVIALIAAAVIVLIGGWSEGAGVALMRAVVAVVILEAGYAAGIVLRSVARALRGRRPEPVQRRAAVPLPNEPKQQ